MAAAGYSRPADRDADWDRKAAARKSGYIYLEAQNQFNLNNFDLYGRLVQRAYDLDSTDSRLGAELGQWALIVTPDNTAEVERGLARIRRYYDLHPDNYFMGMSLASTYAGLKRPDSVLSISRMLYRALPANEDVAMQMAKAYLQRNSDADIDSAIAIYRRLEEAYGTSIDNNINSYIIGAYMMRQDTTAVIGELEKLYNSAPEDIHTILTVGNSMLQLKRPDHALQYLELADSINPDDGGTLMSYLAYYEEVADSAAFVSTMRRAMVNPDLDPDDKFYFLRTFMSENLTDSTRYDLYQELCEDFISQNPGEPDIHLLYATVLASNGHKPEAVEQLSYAVSLDPSNVRSRLMHISLLNECERTDEAIAAGEEYISEMPGEFDLVRLTAALLYQQDKYREAFDMLSDFPVDSLKSNTELSDYYMITGDFASRLEPRSLSYPYYLKAIDLNPDNDMALNNLAYFYSLDGDPDKLDEAERYSAITIRRQPDNPTLLDTYAWILFKKKNYPEARVYIDRVLDLYGLMPAADGDSDGEVNLDNIDPEAFEQGEIEIEEVEVDADDDLSEISADVYDHAGDIYFMTGEPAQALEFWKKALEFDPGNELINKKVTHKTYFFE